MNIGRYQANFDRLCGNLTAYAAANCPPAPAAGDGQRAARAKTLSESLFLAHSTAGAKFARVCREGLKGFTGSVEEQMGTAGHVFFYVSPFRYPSTDCGLLFSQSLETSRREDGLASPFDSGSLLRHCTLPDKTASPQDFLATHELPLPDHRHYLGRCMDKLFGDPADYVKGIEPLLPGPIGLTGGDHRSWTHEVRIKGQVSLQAGHLQAVFAPKAFSRRIPDIRRLFEWCLETGVDRIEVDGNREGDFEALQSACLAYISRKLY